MKKLIIFDMDGTLLDSGIAMLESVNFIRNKSGYEEISYKKLKDHLNVENKKIDNLLDYTKEQKEIFTSHYYENCTKNLKTYDGIPLLLQELKKEFSLAVATNAHTFFANKMLKFCNISDYFDCIAGADSVKNQKPNPEMIEYICNNLGLKLKNTLFVGDSYKDAYAAQNANIPFIFASWGYGNCDLGVSVSTNEELKKEVYRLFM